MKLTYDKETGSVVDAGKAAPSGAPQEADGDDLLSRLEAKHESDLTKEEKRLLQRERLKKLHGKDRLAYLWAYYKYVPALIAAVLFVPVLVEYFRTGLVARFPTLIVSGFVAMAAILSLFSGLILQTMVHKNRQDFEMHLISLRERYKQAIAE